MAQVQPREAFPSNVSDQFRRALITEETKEPRGIQKDLERSTAQVI